MEGKTTEQKEDSGRIMRNAGLTRMFKQLKQTYFPHPLEDWDAALTSDESENGCGVACKPDYGQSLFVIREDTCINCSREQIVLSMAYEMATDLVGYLDTCPDECPHKTPGLCDEDECPEEQMDKWYEMVGDIEAKILLDVCRTARREQDWRLLEAIAFGYFDDPELAFPPESPLSDAGNGQEDVAQTETVMH